MGILEIIRGRTNTKRHTFFKAVDIWASAEESLGVFRPLITAWAGMPILNNKDRLEVMLTLWNADWVDLLKDLSKLGDNDASDLSSFTLYSELFSIVSGYGEEIDRLLDSPDLEVHELLAKLMSANEETTRRINSLERWLDEQARTMQLPIPTYRYSRKAAKRFSNRSFSTVLWVLQGQDDKVARVVRANEKKLRV